MAQEEVPAVADAGNAKPSKDAQLRRPGHRRFLRSGTPFSYLLAASFLGACLGSVGLLIVYHWSHVTVPVYYFVARPALLWFGALLPLLSIGIFAVRLRWFLCGAILWLGCFSACDDALTCLKPFAGRAREKFESARMAFLTCMAGDRQSSATVDVPLRIVTWNVDSGRKGAEPLAAQLAGLRPDVAVMQEFSWGSDRSMSQALKNLPSRKDYHIAQRGEFTVLSRFPLSPIKDPPTVALDWAPFYPWRCAGWQVEVAPGCRVTVLAVHLTPPALKTQFVRGLSWRGLQGHIGFKRRELAEIRKIVDLEAAESPVILLGDFNLPAHYPDLNIATPGLKECFAENGYGWGKTVPAFLPGVRVDMIFVPENANVFFATAVKTRYSDHCAMLAEVSIPVSIQR